MTLSIAEADAQLTAPGQPFEVAVEEIRGLPTRIWKKAPRSLVELLLRSQAHGPKPFIVYEDEVLTFEDHFASAATMADRLVDGFGVVKGDRVAIAMRNFPEWAIAFWAATAAGAVVVPLNAWWTGPELAYGLEDSGTKVVFADGERVERIGEGFDGPVVVARPEPGVAGRFLDFSEVLGVDRTTELPAVAHQLDPEDDATIFYTSGTTGKPKGALGTHRNICTNLMSLTYGGARSALRFPPTPDGPPPPPTRGANAYLLSVPFFHATGCHSVLVPNTAGGGKLVLMHKWDAGRALELIERERITSFGGVPSMVMQVLDHRDFARRDTSSVRGVGYGGAPAPPELVKRIKEHFPVGTPSNGYGMTETSSVSTMNGGPDYIRKPDSVGPPVPVVELKVVDEDGNTLGTNEVGELWIKGPNVVKGYWNKPEATAAAFSDGWVHTGDVARIDEEGFVFIVDRAKDMVIRGGENVYCVEVEAALFEHPAVADCAVIGVPHDVLGEEVGAVVVLRPGTTATAADLQAHLRERLAGFKVPAHVYFRDEPLPRNPAGKALKRELREEVLA